MFNLKVSKFSNNILGVMMMLVHSISLSFYYIIIEVISNKIHPLQTSLMYTSTMLVCITISCCKLGLKHNLKTNFLKHHIMRGFFSSLATIFLFFSIQIIGVSDATALSKLEHCIMTLVGIFVFNEKLDKSKIVLFVGSIISTILLVDLTNIIFTFNKGYLFMLLSLFFWIMNNIFIKKLTVTEKSKSQLFYSSFFSLLVNIMFIFIIYFLPNYIQDRICFKWCIIDLESFIFISLLALTKFLHKLMFFKAYKLSDLSIVSPFDYSRLIFISFLAFLFFGRLPTIREIVGYLCIIITGVYFITYHRGKCF